MTQIGNVYGESLYELAKEENLAAEIGAQLKVMKACFQQEADFVKLLSTPSLTKAERCQILDDSFRGTVHAYVLNFLKILTEKGYMRYFSDCCDAFAALYNQDNGILPVTAVTAIALSAEQTNKLTAKLAQITGKHVELMNRIDPSCLGGVRLDYDGQRLDDTVSHRMATIRDLLKNTVL